MRREECKIGSKIGKLPLSSSLADQNEITPIISARNAVADKFVLEAPDKSMRELEIYNDLIPKLMSGGKFSKAHVETERTFVTPCKTSLSEYQTEHMKKSNSVISFNSPFKSIDGKSSTPSKRNMCKKTRKSEKITTEFEPKSSSNWEDFNESFSIANLEKPLGQ